MLREMGYPPSVMAHIGNRDMTALRAARIVEAAVAELQIDMMPKPKGR